MAHDTHTKCKICGQSIFKDPSAGPSPHYWCDKCKNYTVPERDKYEETKV